MAEVFSQDLNVKASIEGLTKAVAALNKLVSALESNTDVNKSVNAKLTEATNKTIEKAKTGNQSLLSKPIKALNVAALKTKSSLGSLAEKMRGFGSTIKNMGQGFKKLLGIMKSVVLVGGAVTAIFGALVAALAGAQRKNRESTANHYMSPAAMEALKYTEQAFNTDNQVLELMDNMGRAVLNPENYGAFYQAGLDPNKFRNMDARQRLAYAAPILTKKLQSMSDNAIGKQNLVYDPIEQIAGNVNFAKQLFGNKGVNGQIQKGIVSQLLKSWDDNYKFTKGIDFEANAKGSLALNSALSKLQITVDSLSAKAAPSLGKVFEALNDQFKKLEPTILKLIDALPLLIEKLGSVFEWLGSFIPNTKSEFKQGSEIRYDKKALENAAPTLEGTLAKSAAAGVAGGSIGSVVPGVGTVVGAIAGSVGAATWQGINKLINSYLRAEPESQKEGMQMLNDSADIYRDKVQGTESKFSIYKTVSEEEIAARIGNVATKLASMKSSVPEVNIESKMVVEDRRIRVTSWNKQNGAILFNEVVGSK